MDIPHNGPVMLVDNCVSNSPVSNGDCCGCTPKNAQLDICESEGCEPKPCPTQIPLNEAINRISATSAPNLQNIDTEIDSDENIDDDFMDLGIELNDNTSSD